MRNHHQLLRVFTFRIAKIKLNTPESIIDHAKNNAKPTKASAGFNIMNTDNTIISNESVKINTLICFFYCHDCNFRVYEDYTKISGNKKRLEKWAGFSNRGAIGDKWDFKLISLFYGGYFYLVRNGFNFLQGLRGGCSTAQRALLTPVIGGLDFHKAGISNSQGGKVWFRRFFRAGFPKIFPWQGRFWT